MHAYILFIVFNLYSPNPQPSMQEFKSRKSCIDAGVYLKKAIPEISFVCLEK